MGACEVLFFGPEYAFFDEMDALGEGGTSLKMVCLCARKVLVLSPSIAWLGSLCKEGKASVQVVQG